MERLRAVVNQEGDPSVLYQKIRKVGQGYVPDLLRSLVPFRRVDLKLINSSPFSP